MKAAGPNPLIELPVATPLGRFTASYSTEGLAGLDFPRRARPPLRPDAQPGGPAITAEIRRWHRLTEAALNNILAGRAPDELPPLDWAGRTGFQRAVWRQMLKLAPGQTRSYGEIAAAIGHPKAVRAVGGACGANPIPVLVPCHRVLAAHGRIGGFGSGLDWKRELLAREGICL